MPDDEVVVRLEAGRTLDGLVMSDTGTPIAGAQIDAYALGSPSALEATSTRSDAGGRFTLMTLSASVALAVAADGIAPKTITDIRDVHILTMRPGVRLEGQVISAGGEPIERAAVEAKAVDAAFLAAAHTGSDGTFSFDGLPQGCSYPDSRVGPFSTLRRAIQAPASGIILRVDDVWKGTTELGALRCQMVHRSTGGTVERTPSSRHLAARRFTRVRRDTRRRRIASAGCAAGWG